MNVERARYREGAMLLKVVPALALVIMLGSCYTLPGGGVAQHPEFTREAILQLEAGMTMDEVLVMFGPPDRTERRTMGQDSQGGAWQGIIWTYVLPAHPRGRVKTLGSTNDNELTFFTDPYTGLNSWRIELAY